MLIYKGQIIAGGGTIVMPMTRADYEANKTVLDSADVWVDLTDEPDSIADGECIQYNSDMNFEDIGNIATKAIAKVEPSDTALYLHKVGTGFINKDGNYCITDVEIAVGGSIALGTNCHVVDGGMSNDLTNKVKFKDYSFNTVTNTNTSADHMILIADVQNSINDGTIRVLGYCITHTSVTENPSLFMAGGGLYFAFSKGTVFTNASLNIRFTYTKVA